MPDILDVIFPETDGNEAVTKPTQAQIEAELTGVQRLRLQFERNHWRITHRIDGKDMPSADYDLVTAALTAAAEVKKTTLWVHPDISERALTILREQGYNPRIGDKPAAEVEDDEIQKLRSQRIEFDCRYTMGSVAELSGSHCQIDKPCLRCRYERLEAATIERCAQVAENFRHDNPYPHLPGAIAAIIRAMKDES